MPELSTIRRQMLLGALAAPTLAALPRTALAQVPQQSKIILGFAPGGGADLIARILADKMREGLPAGQQIIVRTSKGVLVSVTQPANTSLSVGQKVFIEGSGEDARVVIR